MSKRYIPLRATLSSTVPQIIATPGELLKMSLCVFNKFPLSLPNCDVRCIFKKVTSAKSVTNSERGLRYKCSYFVSAVKIALLRFTKYQIWFIVTRFCFLIIFRKVIATVFVHK